MKTIRSKISIFAVVEGDYDKVFLEYISDLYKTEDIFFKVYPRGDWSRGKQAIKPNLKRLKSQYGIDNNKYIGIYDGDNSSEDLKSKDFKLIKVNRCLEYLILKILEVKGCDGYKNSYDIKSFFREKYKISTKEDFKNFLLINLTKEKIDKKIKKLSDLKEILNIFK
jgi:hypothetical protein